MKLLIFDFDGTIVDSSPLFFEAINEVLVKHKKKPIQLYEHLRDTSVFSLLQEYHIPWYRYWGYYRDVRRVFLQSVRNSKIHPGMKKVLVSFKSQGYTLCLLTSNKRYVVDDILDKFSIDIFDDMCCNQSFFAKHRTLIKLVKKYGISLEDTYYIGDERRDVEAAQFANIQSVAVCWGLNSKKLLKDADYIIQKPKELLTLF